MIFSWLGYLFMGTQNDSTTDISVVNSTLVLQGPLLDHFGSFMYTRREGIAGSYNSFISSFMTKLICLPTNGVFIFQHPCQYLLLFVSLMSAIILSVNCHCDRIEMGLEMGLWAELWEITLTEFIVMGNTTLNLYHYPLTGSGLNEWRNQA